MFRHSAMSSLRMSAVVAVSAGLAPALHAAPEAVVFDQFTDLTTTVFVGSNTNADPQRNWRSIDNVVLQQNAQITGIDWRGILDQRFGDDGLQHTHASEIVGFQVTFWESTQGNWGGEPGNIISDQLILSADVTETDFGSNAQSFSAQLNEAVTLHAGVEYWFSVAAVLPNPDGAVLLWNRWWGNDPLPAGDARSLYDVGADGVLDGHRDADLLFRLRGVPTPGTAAVIALGGLVATRRRR